MNAVDAAFLDRTARGLSRDFRLYWIAELSDALGTQVSGLALPLLLLGLGYSPLAVGVLVSAAGLSGLLAGPFAAVAADRRARKPAMLWSALPAAGAMAWLAAAVACRAPLAELLAAVLLERLATSWYTAASSGTVAALAAPADYPRAVARLEAAGHGSLVVGPALAGVLLQAAHWLPFAADALSYAVCATCITAMRSSLVTAPRARSPRGSIRSEFGEGVRFVWRHSFLRQVLLWTVCVNAVLTAVYYGAVFAIHAQGRGSAPIGVLLALCGAGGLAGALAAPPLARRIPTRRLLAAVSWTMVPLTAGLAWASTVWLYGLLLGAVCFLVPTIVVVLQSQAISATPAELQARAGTALGTATAAATVVAPMAAGALASAIGTARLDLAAAGLLVLPALRLTATGPQPITTCAGRSR